MIGVNASEGKKRDSRRGMGGDGPGPMEKERDGKKSAERLLNHKPIHGVGDTFGMRENGGWEDKEGEREASVQYHELDSVGARTTACKRGKASGRGYSGRQKKPGGVEMMDSSSVVEKDPDVDVYRGSGALGEEKLSIEIPTVL